MSFFPSRHRCCKACSQRKIKLHDEEVIEYYHRGVVCHLVGFDIAVFAQMKPRLWDEPRRLTQFWDVGGFTSAEGVKVPLRVLHAYETITKRERFGTEWIETVEDHHWWWATTFPLSQLPSRQLWKAGHRRWDVENDLFNTLSTHWALDHCFKHDPTAIVNFILTLFIAFVLLQSFSSTLRAG
ncbi:MAG: hypothetical protein ABSB22_27120 [Thermodesulfobacteriota bacterium]